MSARRAYGGASVAHGGSNRTIIKHAQQLVVHPRAGLGDAEVGALVTLDRSYDLLVEAIPTAWQTEIEQVAEQYGADALESKVMKVVALCADVPALPLTQQNIAVLLHPSIGAESVREGVAEAAERLVTDDRLHEGDRGFELQSAEKKGWNKQRRQVEPRPADVLRIRRRILRDAFTGFSVTKGRTFKVEVTVEGEKVTDGDVALHIEEADPTGRADLRASSHEPSAGNRIVWAWSESSDTYEAIVELHRSDTMIDRKDTPSKTAAEVELLGDERTRRTRHENLVRERLSRDLQTGEIIFRGRSDAVPAGELRVAAERLVEDRLADIYHRLDEFAASLARGDVVAVLRSDTLDSLPAALREDGIGLLRLTPEGYKLEAEIGPLAELLAEVRSRSQFGNRTTGRHLEDKFAAAPYGAPVEVIQALLAAAVREGLLEVIYQGARIASPADQRLDRVFGALPQFRAASFDPPSDEGPDLTTRTRLAEELSNRLGERIPHDVENLSAAVRSTFTPEAEICSRVAAKLQGAALRVPEPVEQTRVALDRIAHAPDAEVITDAASIWTDLTSGIETVWKLDEVLEHDLETLQRARKQIDAGGAGLGTEQADELRELRDLVAAGDFAREIARIRGITNRLADARGEATEAARAALKGKLEAARSDLTARFSDLPPASLAEALRPLDDLEPGDDRGDMPLEALEASLDAVDVRAANAGRILEDLQAPDVVRVPVRDLASEPITDEDELRTALERIKAAAEEELADGRHVRLE